MNFTAEQQVIFNFVGKEQGHGIIDAVAGSGKTTTIIECAKFVQDKSTILFCAFNNSIAGEIAQKFRKLGLNEVIVKTIHALGRQILQDNNNSGIQIKLEEGKYRELLKNSKLQRLLMPFYEKLLKINGFESDAYDDRKSFAANNHINRINTRLLEINQKFRATLTKDTLVDFEHLVTHFGIFSDMEAARKNFAKEIKEYFECHKILLQEGNELSKKSMVIDYTDMLYLPFIWKQQPTKKFEFLFIDECQDLSKSQFAIAAKYGKKDGRILAVGDPSQSIYGFTGADIESFTRIKEYTKAQELILTTCFRCPGEVVELAKTIRTDIIGSKTAPGHIQVIAFEDVVKIARSGDLVISRLRAPIVILVFSFIDLNVRVHIHEDEVREIINEIKNIFKPQELNSRISRLNEGFEELKNEIFYRWNWIIQKNSERISDPTERSKYIENEKNYLKTKLDFLHKRYQTWENECDTISEILRRIKDFISSNQNAIKISTIHRAKGLENQRVFILNYDELPYFRTQQKDWERTQEINLKYVAITRSVNELYLIETKKIDAAEKDESLFDNLPFG